MNNHKKHSLRRRVIALLTREEMEFLEKLGMDSLFSTGRKLSRVDVISALIDAAIELELSAKGVKNKKELAQKILNSVRTQIQTDRRQYPRLDKNLHVEFRRMDSLEKYKHSTTENVGLGGFRMEVAYLDKPPQVHQVLEINMKDQVRGESIKAIGRIAWIREKENEEGLEVGVALTYIRKEDQTRFEKYVTEDMNLKNENSPSQP